jgi:hypothetical protein
LEAFAPVIAKEVGTGVGQKSPFRAFASARAFLFCDF